MKRETIRVGLAVLIALAAFRANSSDVPANMLCLGAVEPKITEPREICTMDICDVYIGDISDALPEHPNEWDVQRAIRVRDMRIRDLSPNEKLDCIALAIGRLRGERRIIYETLDELEQVFSEKRNLFE